MSNFSIFDGMNPDYVISETNYRKIQVQQQPPSKSIKQSPPSQSHHELTAAQRQTKTQTEAFSIYNAIL